jgi:uncharacterized protein with PQ loop repeat
MDSLFKTVLAFVSIFQVLPFISSLLRTKEMRLLNGIMLSVCKMGLVLCVIPMLLLSVLRRVLTKAI